MERVVKTAYPRGYTVDDPERNVRTNHWSVLLECGHTIQTSNSRGQSSSRNPKPGMRLDCPSCTEVKFVD